MNRSLTLCCAILLGQTAMGQTTGRSVAIPAAPEDSLSTAGWTTFSRPAVGFELPIPPGLKAVDKSETSTGGSFVSPDETCTMTARGAVISGYPPWVLESNWKQALKQPGHKVEYQQKAATSFVVSGFDRNGTGFYQKFILDGNKVATFTLTYPYSRRREFESRVSAMEKGFRIVVPPPPVPVRDVAQSPDPSPMVNVTPPASRPAPAPIKQPVAATPAFQDAANLVLEEKAAPEAPPPKEAVPQEARLPYGMPVEGKPGFVLTPYGSKQIVDVVDLSPGTKVRCPYTGKLFRVP